MSLPTNSTSGIEKRKNVRTSAPSKEWEEREERDRRGQRRTDLVVHGVGVVEVCGDVVLAAVGVEGGGYARGPRRLHARRVASDAVEAAGADLAAGEGVLLPAAGRGARVLELLALDVEAEDAVLDVVVRLSPAVVEGLACGSGEEMRVSDKIQRK